MASVSSKQRGFSARDRTHFAQATCTSLAYRPTAVPPPIVQALQAKAVQHFPKHPAIKSLPVLQNKHFVMWSLVAGATGMFIGAGMGGIRGNEQLRDIYDRRTGGSLTEQQVRILTRSWSLRV